MYSKCNQLLKSPSLSSLQNKTHRITHRFNSVTSSATPTFKYSANINNKDCLRLAVIYGMCGTFCSYLSMNYDGKVLVFKWSVPTPERFLFCAWCWAMGGMASWTLFWTKPDALIRAASSRVRYGLFHGTQTTSLAVLFSFGTIGFWSFYFDVKDWQMKVGDWQKALGTLRQTGTQTQTSAKALMTDINSTMIEEEGNEEGDSKVNIVNMDEMNGGVQIINQKITETDEINMDKVELDRNTEIERSQKLDELRDNKPLLTYQIIVHNMWEPNKLFFLCNAPIWLICGSFTGMVAARVLTNGVLLNPTNITTAFAAFCVDSKYKRNDLHLLDE